MPAQPERIAYSVAEAAALTGYSRYRMYELIWKGGLPAYKHGANGQFRILRDDLIAWIKANPAEPEPDRYKRRAKQ